VRFAKRKTRYVEARHWVIRGSPIMFMCVVTAGKVAICDIECEPSPIKQREVVVFSTTIESNLPFIDYKISIAVTPS